MAVYVDDARHPYGRMIMGHMVADTIAELHKMANAIGMKPIWYQPTSWPHYDVSRARRAHAIALGAIEVDRRGIVTIKRRLRASESFKAEVRRSHRAQDFAVPRWAETTDKQIGPEEEPGK